ncbi:MAG TPA: cytochrome c oxidase assembly protein [Burkholderiales bacterium]|nr:cytochrome c oxidase assembly protein [Burkholderiales bacterium]
MSGWLAFLLPWEFSPLAAALALGAAVAFVRGARRAPPPQAVGVARRIGFFAGLALLYFVMQTHFDYLSQHMFYIHRLQHLALHHAGPFLIALSQPQAVIARGLPQRLHERVLTPAWRHPLVQGLYRLLQNWLVAPVLFVGLIFLWLTPEVHFYAMLSGPLYHVMNWSMLLDGLLFWFLMLDPRSKEQGALLSLGPRIGILLAAAVPQLALGAHIALADHDLFDVYAICGRAWAISPLEDQEVGGLVTWIPAAMMHGVGTLVVLSYWMRSK